jgi:hypothetical protein
MLEKKWDESFINGIYGSSTRLIEHFGQRGIHE